MKTAATQPSAVTRSNPVYSLENGPKCQKRSGVTAGYCEAEVTAEILARARAYAAAVPGAISGNRGHDQTFALANALTWGFALDEQTALVLMLKWNAGCQPPWKERELRHKVSQAMKAQHAKPRGHLLGTGLLPLRREPTAIAPPAERAVWKVRRHTASIQHQLSQVELPVLSLSNSMELKVADPFSLLDPPVPVRGCAISRPPKLAVDDDSWRTLNAAGLANNPVILEALLFFGPRCQVLETSPFIDGASPACPRCTGDK